MVTETELKPAFKTEVINCRTIVLRTHSKLIKEIKEGNNIVSLIHSSGSTVKINDEIIIDNNPYKARKIKKQITEEKATSVYKIFSYELTKTSLLILPLLGLKSTDLFKDSLFCNSYVGYKDKDYGKYLYMLYRCNNEEEFEKLETNLLDLDLDLKTLDISDNFCLFRLNFPNRFKEDISIIVSGKYSKISKEAKFCISQYHKAKKTTPIYQILHKLPDRKKVIESAIGETIPDDAELYSAFNSSEIYT